MTDLCERAQDRLAEDGVAAMRGDAALATHISSCDDCLAVMAGLQDLDLWLGAEVEAPQKLLDATVDAALLERPAPPVATPPEPVRVPRRWPRLSLSAKIGGLGLAASVLLVAGVGSLARVGDSGPQTESADDFGGRSDRFASVLAENGNDNDDYWGDEEPEETVFEETEAEDSVVPDHHSPVIDELQATELGRALNRAVVDRQGGGRIGDARQLTFGDDIVGGEFAEFGEGNGFGYVGGTGMRGNSAVPEEPTEPLFAPGQVAQENRSARRDRSRFSSSTVSPDAPPPAPAAAPVLDLSVRAPDDDGDGFDFDRGEQSGEGEYRPANPEFRHALEEDGRGPYGTVTGEAEGDLNGLREQGRRVQDQRLAQNLPVDAPAAVEEPELERSFEYQVAIDGDDGQPATERSLVVSGLVEGRDAGPERDWAGSGVVDETDSELGWNGRGRDLLDRGVAISRSAFLEERDQVENLSFQDARGYWRNTYVPGDPFLRQLEERLGGGARAVSQSAAAIGQPFDAPDDAALAVYLSTDRRSGAGETRTLVQVGIQGTERRSGRRPSMNIAVVLDMSAPVDTETGAAIRTLLEEFANASDVGDRFSLVVAGRDGGVVIPAGEMRFGQATVAAQWLTGATDAPAELGDPRNLTITEAYDEAIGIVSNDDDPTAPLGSTLVWVVTGGTLGSAAPGLEARAHHAAVAGVPTSVLGVGNGVATGELDQLALRGQGTRRHLERAADAEETVADEINAASSVVARAVRLRIRLAPGVQLVDVIGSERLDTQQVERVRQAERSIDQRLSRSMGIQADRGEDEDGIQIVIPAFYAGDSHVILLDVVAPGTGPVADVTMRYKDLINLRNGTSRASTQLARGELDRGPLERNVLKNLLAWELAEALRSAGSDARRGNAPAAAATLDAFASRLRDVRAILPGMAGDPDVDADLSAVAAYLRALRDTSLTNRPNDLADALLYSSYRELQPPVTE